VHCGLGFCAVARRLLARDMEGERRGGGKAGGAQTRCGR